MITLMVSGGNGPGECQQAVAHVLARMASEAESLGVTLDSAERPGRHGPVSAALVVTGPRAAEFVKRWEGALMWRCPSALRPRHRRKTWFVEVFRLPETVPDRRIEPQEVTMQAIRAGGPGGQHQNKTSSAIRASWGPYAVVVRDERSQHRNRAIALDRLRALAEADARAARDSRAGQAHALHHRVQRGAPLRVFEGPEFIERTGGGA